MTSDSIPLDRSRPPAAAALRPFEFPRFDSHELANGLRLFLAPSRSTELFQLELLAPGGGLFAPAQQPGLASLSAALLDEGSDRHSAMELALSIERYGGTLVTGCDWERSYIAVMMLSEHLPRAIETLSQMAVSASFPPAEVERLRQERLAEVARRQRDPSSLALDCLATALYDGSAYGYPLVGTSASLAKLSRDQCYEHYRRTVFASDVLLLAAGSFSSDDLISRLEDALATLGTAAPPTAVEIPSAAAEEVHVVIVDRPEASQTEIRLGHPGPPRNAPGRAERQVLNSILGGKFTSRINLNLRERHGFTYGANSRFVERLGPGPFVINAAVDTHVAARAVGEVIKELERIQSEVVETHELDDAKSYILGVFPYTLQTLQGICGRMEEIGTYSLPTDYHQRHAEAVGAVTREGVLEAARAHLRPRACVVVAVGPAADLESQFDSFERVTVTHRSP